MTAWLRRASGGVTGLLCALLCLMMLLISALERPFAVTLRDAVHDAFQRQAPRAYDTDTPVHVVDIDEAALAAYGQWPWPRTYMAVLAEKLFLHGAVVVGFDVLFPEPDRTASPPAAAPAPFSGAALPVPLPPAPTHDDRLAAALAAGPTVLGIAGAPEGSQPVPKAGISFSGAAPGDRLTRYGAALESLPVLTQAATGVGSVSTGALRGGVVRSLPAVTQMGDVLVPAFALEVLRVAQGAGGYILRTTDASGEIGGRAVDAVSLRVGALDVPLSANGHVRLNYSGTQAARTTPAARLLQTDGIDPDLEARLAGRIVLVGSSAQALFDIRTTPLEHSVPGVIIHAELIEQIAAGAYLQRPDWARGLEVLAILLTGLLIAAALVLERPVLSLCLAAACATASVGGAAWAFFAHGLLLDPTFPALTAPVVFLPGASFGLLMKERARAAVRARFTYFLPSDIVDDIVADPAAALTPKGAERELTVLFSDIRGFTTATENMPPDAVVRYVNTFLGTVSDALVASGATIDKFMGDAVMAFWNAPLEVPDHPAQAMRALGRVQDAIRAANAALPGQGLPEIDIALGVNTGVASVGLMGSSDRLSYTCIGDNVTLAARLEGLTRQYGVGNCVSASAIAGLPDDLLAICLDVIAVKGRTAAAPVFTVVPRTADTEATAADIAAARAAYLARDWDAAHSAFAKVADMRLEGRSLAPMAETYQARLADFTRSPPPEDWDGSARAQTK